MSGKGRDQPNSAQSVSWFLSTTTAPHPARICNLLCLGLVKCNSHGHAAEPAAQPVGKRGWRFP